MIWTSIEVDTVINARDSIDNATKMYKKHPCIFIIKKLAFEKCSFSFNPIYEGHVQTAISKFDTSKSYAQVYY